MYFNNNSVKVSRQFFFLRVSTFLIGCCFFKLLIKRARESRELRDFSGSGSGSGSGSTKKQWLHGSTAPAPARLHKPGITFYYSNLSYKNKNQVVNTFKR